MARAKEVEPINEAPVQATGEEKVKIYLHKDTNDDRYNDDLFVAVNGRTFKIQRGKEVEVPACVAEVIRHSQKADADAQRKREAKANRNSLIG